MKKKLLVAALLVALLSICTMGSLAYFTASTTAENVITSGSIDIELREWANTEETEPFTDKTGVMPGTAVTKIVRVENIGTGTAWIRVRVDKAFAFSADAVLPEGFTADTSLIGLNMNTTGWKEQNGYWYYQKPLAAGDKTEPLFTTVSFAAGMDNNYQRANAIVTVYADAAQVANNGTSAETAAEASWPVA